MSGPRAEHTFSDSPTWISRLRPIAKVLFIWHGGTRCTGFPRGCRTGLGFHPAMSGEYTDLREALDFFFAKKQCTGPDEVWQKEETKKNGWLSKRGLQVSSSRAKARGGLGPNRYTKERG